MRRVFIPDDGVSGEKVTLRGDEAHYLGRVLRMAEGGRFRAVLSDGSEWVAMISDVGSDHVWALLGEPLDVSADPTVDLHVYFGLTKAGKPELVVQKCTELGVSVIHPMLCRRSVSRPDADRGARKAERWRKIAGEAGRQCGRTAGAEVAEPVRFADAVAAVAASGGSGLIAALGVGESARLEGLALREPVSLLVGPEGGFDDEEVRAATESGLTPITLGPRVLRAETATIAASALLMHLLGEME